MANRCEYVDPMYNQPCGKPTTLGKITFQFPDSTTIITKFACKIHGDPRFDILSLSENNLIKLKDTNKIPYNEFAEKIQSVRWKKCRSCNSEFGKTDITCNVTWWYWADTKIGLRRSFQIHDDCMKSLLKLFEVQNDSKVRNLKITDSFQS